MKAGKIFTITAGLTLTVTTGALLAVGAIDKQKEKMLQEQRLKNFELGFPDIEIDNLHGILQNQIRTLHRMIKAEQEAVKNAENVAGSEDVVRIDVNFNMKRFQDESYQETPDEVKLGPDGKPIKKRPDTLAMERDRFIRKISELGGEIASAEQVFSIKLGIGMSFRPVGKRFLFDTWVHLFTDKGANDLKGLMFQFDRVNATGLTFLGERRLLINPKPENKAGIIGESNGFTDASGVPDPNLENKPDDPNANKEEPVDFSKIVLDRNDDLTVEYFEIQANDQKFPVQPVYRERLLWDDYKDNPAHYPMDYKKQVELLASYKQYLRQTRQALQRVIQDFQLKRNVRMGKMKDFN